MTGKRPIPRRKFGSVSASGAGPGRSRPAPSCGQAKRSVSSDSWGDVDDGNPGVQEGVPDSAEVGGSGSSPLQPPSAEIIRSASLQRHPQQELGPHTQGSVLISFRTLIRLSIAVGVAKGRQIATAPRGLSLASLDDSCSVRALPAVEMVRFGAAAD